MNFLKKPTLYVVEDDDATRDALHRLFVTLDVNVNTFSCAETFLESTIEPSRSCLIVDVNLPGQNGIELLEHLKRCECSIPTIILDSSGEVQTAVEAMRIGAIDFIEKPFVDRVLLRRICDVLNVNS